MADDPPGGTGRHRYRVLGLLTGLLVAAAVGALALQATGGLARLAGDDPDRLPDRLAAQVVAALERPPGTAGPEPAGPGRQGHPLADAGPGRIVCAARTFGFDPPDATTVAQVRVVYAHHMCAELGPGLSWPGAVRAAGPVAVELAGPVAVHRPEQALPGNPDATHAERVRALIPQRYHRPALAAAGLADPEVAEQLRRRFEAAQDRA